MRVKIATFVVAALISTSYPLHAETSSLQKDQQQTFYAIGASIARTLEVFDLTTAEFEQVKQGLIDARSGKNKEFDQAAWNPKIQELARARRLAAGEKQASAGKAMLENTAGAKGAVKTSSGMVYIPVVEGKGSSPKATDVVKVHYRGTLADGKEFDSSYMRGRPIEFRLDNVISCWTEGMQMMKAGGKAKFICPPQLAYGDKGAGERILPGATLAFDVELLEVTRTGGEQAAAPPAVGKAGAAAGTASAPSATR